MTDCPCGSGLEYAKCCEPYHDGAPIPTAEACMRSRYSAFVVHRLEHLKNTLLPRKRQGFDPKDVEEWSTQSEWQGLEIVSTVDGGEKDDAGEVEFIARFKMNEQDHEYRENGIFKQQDGTWYYVTGQVKKQDQVVRSGPKVGRNDPCPCGSGKKHKKCCG